MSSPARSWSLITTASASWNFSRKRTSSMQVSSGRPHILTSNQRGRGNDPVTVLGRIRLAVAVNMGFSYQELYRNSFLGARLGAGLDPAWSQRRQRKKLTQTDAAGVSTGYAQPGRPPVPGTAAGGGGGESVSPAGAAGAAFCSWISCSNGMLSEGRCTGTGPVLSMPGWRGCPGLSGARSEE